MTLDELLTKLKALEAVASEYTGTPIKAECGIDTDFIAVHLIIKHPGEDEHIGIGFTVTSPDEVAPALDKLLADMGAA